jgi:hypothetical protein
VLKCLYQWKWWKTRLTVGIHTATRAAFTSIEVCPREVEKWSKLISVNVLAASDLLHCLSPDVHTHTHISALRIYNQKVLEPVVMLSCVCGLEKKVHRPSKLFVQTKG